MSNPDIIEVGPGQNIYAAAEFAKTVIVDRGAIRGELKFNDITLSLHRDSLPEDICRIYFLMMEERARKL